MAQRIAAHQGDIAPTAAVDVTCFTAGHEGLGSDYARCLIGPGEFSLGQLAHVVAPRLQRELTVGGTNVGPKCIQVAPPSEIGRSHPSRRALRSSRPRWPCPRKCPSSCVPSRIVHLYPDPKLRWEIDRRAQQKPADGRRSVQDPLIDGVRVTCSSGTISRVAMTG